MLHWACLAYFVSQLIICLTFMKFLKKHLQIKLGWHILVCQGDVCNRAKGRTHILMDFFLFSKKELDKDQTKIFLNWKKLSNWGQVLQVQVPREIGHKSASITTKVFEAVCSVEKERRVKNKETAKFEKVKSAKVFKAPRLEKSNVSSNPVATLPASTGHNKTRDKCSETNLQSASTSLA